MLHVVQRFLQEHGEVQLSALGLGVFPSLPYPGVWRTVR